MMPIYTYLLIYLLGGFTLLPGVFLYCWLVHLTRQSQQSILADFPSEPYSSIDEHQGKKGWIRMVEHAPSSPVPVKKSTSFTKTMASLSKSNHHQAGSNYNSEVPLKDNSGPIRGLSSSTLFYGVLRHGTLFCFDNEQEKTCHLILPLHDYTISLYPSQGKTEAELYGRTISICLTPKKNKANSSTYYLSCKRATDKEDWYLALLASSHLLSEGDDSKTTQHPEEWLDTTIYDMPAMFQLQRLLGGTRARQEAQWWNALMGRIFLGLYKTDYWKQFWYQKLKTKLDKINAIQQQQHLHHPFGDNSSGSENGKRTMGLSPLQLQFVSMGDAIPCLTSPKLMEFGSDGHCTVHAQCEYDGNFLGVIRTDFQFLWPSLASSLAFERKRKSSVTSPSPTISSATPSTTTASLSSSSTTSATSLSGVDITSSPPGSFPLVLSIKLRRCYGKLVFKVKPPPSNRVWLAFEDMPQIEWEVTPIVLDKQIKWSLVTNLIQAKLNELVTDNLVMPNMEDFPFFESEGLGGIFGERAPMNDLNMSEHTHTDLTAERVSDIIATTIATADSRPSSIIHKDDIQLAEGNDDGMTEACDEKQQQSSPVPKVVQGYMNKIKAPHKLATAFQPRPANAAAKV